MISLPLLSLQATPRRGGGFFILLLLLLPVMANAQSLKLEDVFTTSTQQQVSSLSLSDLDRSRSQELLNAMEGELEAENYQRVLQVTSLLSAWLSKEDQDYARLLWYRARAYEGTREREKMSTIGVEYLQRFPEGKNAGWFLVRLATERARQGKFDDAAVFYRNIIRRDLALSPGESLAGADILLRAGFAKDTRKLLEKGFAGVSENEPGMSSLLARRDYFLLESLLVDDDPKIPIPDVAGRAGAPPGGIEVRRALLHEIRGETEAARTIYRRLAAQRMKLGDQEDKIVRERRDALEEGVWPR